MADSGQPEPVGTASYDLRIIFNSCRHGLSTILPFILQNFDIVIILAHFIVDTS